MNKIHKLHAGAHNTICSEASKSPHILLVLDQIPKTLGGGERIVLRLASLLPLYGYRVSIVTFHADLESPCLISPPCPIYLLPLKRTYGLAAFMSALCFRSFLKEQNVLIVQTFFESSDLWAGFVTKATTKAKLIWSRRDMGILRSKKHYIAYRLMSRFPDAVFTVSELVRRHCIDVDHIEPSRVQTIYNGLSLEDWDKSPIDLTSLRNPVIATVGNIRHVKGHDIFIRAAALVIQKIPQTSFYIIGDVLDPDYFSDLQLLVRNLGLTNCFHFVAGITNPKEHLSNADIFVLSSRSEGFSNAIIEAMATSLPVVATNVGGNGEAVKDGVSGLLVPADDPISLSQAILQILSDPEKARKMGASGREYVKEKFTTDAMMRSITEAYKHLHGSFTP